MDQSRENLIGLNHRAMADFFAQLGERSYRAVQTLKWIHRHGVGEFEAMTDLSKSLRSRLGDIAEIRPPEVVGHKVSADGTHKWLLSVDANNCIETVFIPETDRGTLCISSQVGCALNCRFCSTARQGFNRNLTVAEIVGQLWVASRRLDPMQAGDRTITNIVLMGMGEPLLNFENVVNAIDLLLDDNAYGLARRRVTLSTAGMVPEILKLKNRCPVSLAVSLHAPTDELRDELVPLNRKYPIRELLAACRDYVAHAPKANVTFEYVMLDGVNDSAGHAGKLATLLRGFPAKVNLIPFNPFPGAGYRRSPVDAIDRFREILVAAGLVTITRRTRGEDIDAACGQLAGRVQPRALRIARARGVRGAGCAPKILTNQIHGGSSY